MYVYIRDLQMPMRTALGMNTQRWGSTFHYLDLDLGGYDAPGV